MMMDANSRPTRLLVLGQFKLPSESRRRLVLGLRPQARFSVPPWWQARTSSLTAADLAECLRVELLWIGTFDCLCLSLCE